MKMASKSEIENPKDRKGRSFSRLVLRGAVLVCISLLAVASLPLGITLVKSRAQRIAVEILRNNGHNVWYEYQLDDSPALSLSHPLPKQEQRPRGPAWLNNIVGEDLFNKVVAVKLHGASVDDFRTLENLPDIARLECEDPTTEKGFVYLQGLKNLRFLYLDGDKITDDAFKSMGRHPQLKILRIANAMVTDAGLASLTSMKDLEELDLYELVSKKGISDVVLAYLADLKSLKWLELRDTNISDAGLPYLQKLSNLEYLGLGGTKITGEGFAQVVGFKSLKFLPLDGTNITDAGLANIKKFPCLGFLHLDNTNITDTGLQHLIDLKELWDLSLDGTKITDTGLKHLTNLNKLWDLSLDGTKITDTGLQHLTNLNKLRDLSLNGTKITDTGLQHLTNLKELRHLSLDGTRITDTGLQHLINLNKLWHLSLKGTRITDTGLQDLARLVQSSRVERSNTGVTGSGSIRLAPFEQLRYLCLDSTQISDAGLSHLQGLSLEELSLNETCVTRKGCADLRTRMPRCTIVFQGKAFDDEDSTK